jgi:hypothetical protein
VLTKQVAARVKEAILAEMRTTETTQMQLAIATGIDPSHISKVLAGKVVGSFDCLERLASAVGLEIVVRRKQ